VTNPQRVGKDEPERIVLSNINEYGWHCVNVIEDNGCPPWTFSIGLYETWQHPELIVIGRSRATAHKMLESIATQIEDGDPPSSSGRAVHTSLYSRGDGGPEARLRSASRILRRSACESVVTSM
jgi:hypothetical protein